MTALISAAEEDPHAPGHTWVTNDEGWEVLAAALLLDRRIHRPKVRSRFDNVCLFLALSGVLPVFLLELMVEEVAYYFWYINLAGDTT